MHCLREVGPPGEFSAYGGMPTLRSATAEPSNYSRSFFYVTREPDVKQQQKKHSSVLDRDRVKSAKPFFVCVCVSFLLSFFPDFSSFFAYITIRFVLHFTRSLFLKQQGDFSLSQF